LGSIAFDNRAAGAAISRRARCFTVDRMRHWNPCHSERSEESHRMATQYAV